MDQNDNWTTYPIDENGKGLIIYLNAYNYVQFQNTKTTLNTQTTSYVSFVITDKVAAMRKLYVIIK